MYEFVPPSSLSSLPLIFTAFLWAGCIAVKKLKRDTRGPWFGPPCHLGFKVLHSIYKRFTVLISFLVYYHHVVNALNLSSLLLALATDTAHATVAGVEEPHALAGAAGGALAVPCTRHGVGMQNMAAHRAGDGLFAVGKAAHGAVSVRGRCSRRRQRRCSLCTCLFWPSDDAWDL